MSTKKTLKTSLLLATLSMGVGCSSNNTFKVTSSPEGAEVFARSVKSDTYSKLGVTPLVLETSQIKDDSLKEGPIYLELRKEGHEKSNILVTEMSSQDLEIYMKMTVQEKFQDAMRFDEVGNYLFETQRLIRLQNYEEAHKEIDKVLKDYPELSISHEMKGGIYYLEKKYKEALNSFRIAFRNNPKNMVARRMKAILEQQLGTKETAQN